MHDNVETILSCHCGAVQLSLAFPPQQVTECNCSLCRRYGVLWAYYTDAEVTVLTEPLLTDTYVGKAGHVDFHRCRDCGCVTHWVPRTKGRNQRGVNARLLPVAVLAAATLRHKDGAGSGKYLD